MKPTPEQVQQLVAKLQAKMTAEDDFTRRHGHARFPVYADLDGKMIVAIKGALYRQTQEGPYDLINVYHDTGLDLFGEELVAAEMGLPFEQRHPAIQFLSAAVEQNALYRADGVHRPTGCSAAWGRLGYDLFTVRDNAQLLDKLKGELLRPGNYQAARCELLVCSIAVTAGFEIHFEDEKDNTQRHVEFFAEHKQSGLVISVEAKSRHRYGVLGFEGGHAANPGAEVGIRGVLEKALRKQPPHPMYTFIDVNLPPGTDADKSRWHAEMKQTVLDLYDEGVFNDSPLCGIFFVNDPSHYIGTGALRRPEHTLWAYPFKLRNLQLPGAEEDVMDRLMLAWRQRNDPPRVGPGG